MQGVKDSRIRVPRSLFFQAVRRDHQRSMLKNYKELTVWQKSYKLCWKIYRITAKFPKKEKYGLFSQIRRSAVSIPANIAEGYGRKTALGYIRMLYISYGLSLWIGSPDIISRGFGFNWKRRIGYIKKRDSRNRKNAKSANKVFRKQTLESLDPLLQLIWRRTKYCLFWIGTFEKRSLCGLKNNYGRREQANRRRPGQVKGYCW